MTEPDDSTARGGRGEVVLLLCVYVVPLLGVSVLLALVGLGGLALALLGVEAVVAGATLWAKRHPAARQPAPARSRWLVPLGIVAVLLAVVGISLLGARWG